MLNRENIGNFKKWWITLDKRILFLAILLVMLGNLFAIVASPIIANRIGIANNTFIIKNAIFSCIGIFLMIAISTLNETRVIRSAFVGFMVFLLLMVVVLFFGSNTKGATRWIYISGFSLQPSEIIKPLFVIVTSFILTNVKKTDGLNILLAAFCYIFVTMLLVLQPDIGMFVLISIIFFTELFLNGVPIKYFIWLGLFCIILFISLYFAFPHFQSRIDGFVKSSVNHKEASYQITKSLDSFANGGFMGKGPMEGSVKNHLPDAHTDFIFSVIGEEFGAFICLILIGIFFYITLRASLKTTCRISNFRYLSVNSLVLLFLFQACINMGVTMNILPTKGMTLPLLSYGGSSMLGVSVTIGYILALSRKDFCSLDPQFKEALFIS